MNKENRFFYSYSRTLTMFLRYNKEIDWNCTGIHPDTGRQFHQFDRTEELLAALTEYGQVKGNALTK